jgi:hypothetical protein
MAETGEIESARQSENSNKNSRQFRRQIPIESSDILREFFIYI